MIRVRRANVILDIPENQQSEYLAKGFDVISEKGEILVEATMSNDVHTLHKKLTEAQEKIKVLEKENRRLTQKLEAISLSDDSEEDQEQEGLVDPPKKKKKKKVSE